MQREKKNHLNYSKEAVKLIDYMFPSLTANDYSDWRAQTRIREENRNSSSQSEEKIIYKFSLGPDISPIHSQEIHDSAQLWALSLWMDMLQILI